MVSSEEKRSLVIWPDFHCSVVSAISDLRTQDSFFDVTVFAQERGFPAHKLILSACSGLFKKIFQTVSNKTIQVVKFKDIQPLYLQRALDFMYQGQIELTESQLPTFLAVAKKLQLKGLSRFHQTTGRSPQPPKRPISGTPSGSPQVSGSSSAKSEMGGEVPAKRRKVIVAPAPPEPPPTHESLGMATMVAESPLIWTAVDMPIKIEGPEADVIETSVSASVDDDSGLVTTTVSLTVPHANEPPAEPPSLKMEVTPLSTEEKEKAERTEYFESIYRQGAVVGPNGLSGFECKYCKKLYNSRSALRNHFQEIHAGTQIPCEYCGKMYPSQKRIRGHQKKDKCTM
ncbi:modifier of mdg4-like [Tigriopus californicus]|uniref:modifier of mdg4-like n=1 Tax=Tigriopus californicus TaxID=6832 RepID=UPI0027DA86D0|nr:modifier of mdg4-like [Tigriopus californicus]